MAFHKMTLNTPWFDYVKTGRKIYEGRCNKKKYSIGDKIIFSHHIDHSQDEFEKTIIDVLHYKSFEEALNELSISQVLPNINTINDGVEIYKKYVSLETQKKCGIIMIKME